MGYPARYRLRQLLLAGALISCAGAGAQAPTEIVRWSAVIAQQRGSIAPGGDATVEIDGTIDEGWHIYGLQQLPGGPIPLRVTLDAGDTVVAAGDPSESATEKFHDSRFGLDTQFHTHTLSIRLPVRIPTSAAAGSHSIALSVRFQLCSEGECKPPRTVHLQVPIEVTPHA